MNKTNCENKQKAKTLQLVYLVAPLSQLSPSVQRFKPSENSRW